MCIVKSLESGLEIIDPGCAKSSNTYEIGGDVSIHCMLLVSTNDKVLLRFDEIPIQSSEQKHMMPFAVQCPPTGNGRQ